MAIFDKNMRIRIQKIGQSMGLEKGSQDFFSHRKDFSCLHSYLAIQTTFYILTMRIIAQRNVDAI